MTTLDVGVPEEAEEIIRIADSMAPVGGIFHLAMYLADKLVTNQVTHQGLHPRATGSNALALAALHCCGKEFSSQQHACSLSIP